MSSWLGRKANHFLRISPLNKLNLSIVDWIWCFATKWNTCISLVFLLNTDKHSATVRTVQKREVQYFTRQVLTCKTEQACQISSLLLVCETITENYIKTSKSFPFETLPSVGTFLLMTLFYSTYNHCIFYQKSIFLIKIKRFEQMDMRNIFIQPLMNSTWILYSLTPQRCTCSQSYTVIISSIKYMLLVLESVNNLKYANIIEALQRTV